MNPNERLPLPPSARQGQQRLQPQPQPQQQQQQQPEIAIGGLEQLVQAQNAIRARNSGGNTNTFSIQNRTTDATAGSRLRGTNAAFDMTSANHDLIALGLAPYAFGGSRSIGVAHDGRLGGTGGSTNIDESKVASPRLGGMEMHIGLPQPTLPIHLSTNERVRNFTMTRDALDQSLATTANLLNTIITNNNRRTQPQALPQRSGILDNTVIPSDRSQRAQPTSMDIAFSKQREASSKPQSETKATFHPRSIHMQNPGKPMRKKKRPRPYASSTGTASSASSSSSSLPATATSTAINGYLEGCTFPLPRLPQSVASGTLTNHRVNTNVSSSSRIDNAMYRVASASRGSNQATRLGISGDTLGLSQRHQSRRRRFRPPVESSTVERSMTSTSSTDDQRTISEETTSSQILDDSSRTSTSSHGRDSSRQRLQQQHKNQQDEVPEQQPVQMLDSNFEEINRRGDGGIR